MKPKERTQLHFAQMNNEVKKELNKKSKMSGLSQWLIAEKILEAALVTPRLDIKKWLKTI